MEYILPFYMVDGIDKVDEALSLSRLQWWPNCTTPGEDYDDGAETRLYGKRTQKCKGLI